MRADIKHGRYMDCHLCGGTVMHALVASETRSITICTPCLDRLLDAVERAKRKDERTLFTTAVE